MPGGRLFVVAAPSGAGKTSLVKALLEREPKLRVCVSHTTRPKRPNEVDGRDYHFVERGRFQQMVADGAFLEHAAVFDNFYGTSLGALQDAFGAGFDVVLEIDWQGARQVRERVPECISIFILPPSRRALEQRLRDRRTDSDAVIARRLADAVGDMGHYGEFDCVVVNDDFETAVGDLRRIVAAAREGGPQNAGLGSDRAALRPLLADLLG
jgi:guanylate kinase